MQPENSSMNRRSNPAVSSGLIAGLVMTAAGVILLLDRTGVIEGRYLFRFWPSVLVIIGLLKVAMPEAGGGRPVHGSASLRGRSRGTLHGTAHTGQDRIH